MYLLHMYLHICTKVIRSQIFLFLIGVILSINSYSVVLSMSGRTYVCIMRMMKIGDHFYTSHKRVDPVQYVNLYIFTM